MDAAKDKVNAAKDKVSSALSGLEEVTEFDLNINGIRYE
jgi:hypothetical protein